jgi:hypothetical protein
MIAENEDQTTRVEELRALFRATQALPQAQALTYEMIAEEVESYRVGDDYYV